MEYSRLTLGVGAVLLVTITMIELTSAIIQRMQPQVEVRVPPQPTYAFGYLPAISFPTQAASEKPSSYTLQIPGVVMDGQGGWPVFGDLGVVEVYKVNPFNFSLSADSKIRQIATNLEFFTEPTFIDERTYQYRYPGPPLEETLDIDSKTMFVDFNTNYLSTTNLFAVPNTAGTNPVPNRIESIAAVRNYLDVAGILPDDLSFGEGASTEYMTSIGAQLHSAASALSAEYVAVSLPRQGLPGLRNDAATTYNFYGPDGYSSIYGVVGRDHDGNDIVVTLNYNYYPLNTEDVGTYVLRSAASAWSSLQAGEAYVVNPRHVSQAVITSVELGYYESHGEQEYMMPIYVFKGNNDFVAYVQALDSRQLY